MGRYVVRQGDCLSSIAARFGFDWQSLWEHPDNAALRSQRGNPNVLSPGDLIEIPDLRPWQESAATEQRHRFVHRGSVALLRVCLLIDGEPRNNCYCRISIDGRLTEGSTDGDGVLEVPIPSDACRVQLWLRDGDGEDVYEFTLGELDPVDTEPGARARLSNLGFLGDGELPEVARCFQRHEELLESGGLDEATRARLMEVYGQ